MGEDKKKIENKIEKTDKKSANINIEQKIIPVVAEELNTIDKKNNEAEELPEEVKKILAKQIEARKTDNREKKRKKKSTDKHIISGKAFIKATYNNTVITITELNGNVISSASAGLVGFKGPKEATPYAAQIITKIAADRAKEFGLKEVNVFVKGVGTGRESAVRALNANGLFVTAIKDITPIPHNGCRIRKVRRV